LLTAHIVASVSLVGSSIELLLAALRAARSSDPVQAHTLYELVRLLTFALGVPFSLVALATGVTVALRSRWGIFRYWWVTGKLACLLVTIAIGALVDNREIDALRRATSDGASGGAARWLLAGGFAAQTGLVLTATGLAVFKPRRWFSQERRRHDR
jgi:uncharacterized membrane protein